MISVDRKLEQGVLWRTSPSAEFPYEAEHEGRRWRVRINDFPLEPLYTLDRRQFVPTVGGYTASAAEAEALVEARLAH